MPEEKTVIVTTTTTETVKKFSIPENAAIEISDNHDSLNHLVTQNNQQPLSWFKLIGVGASIISTLIALTQFLEHQREVSENRMHHQLDMHHSGHYHERKRSNKVHDARFSHSLR